MRVGTAQFVGAQLKAARDARGLTAVSLADLLGVSRQAVHDYENGRKSPNPEVMRRITEVLQLPLQRFLRPPLRNVRGPIFARSLTSTLKSARVRAEGRYEWLREVVAYLRTLVRFPTVNFPKFNVPDDHTRLSLDDIERLAIETRRFWRLRDGPISNVVLLLENNGGVVAMQEFGADGLDAFSEWRPEDPSPFFVLGSDKGCAVRFTFDAAHELGHMILHRSFPAHLLNKPSPQFVLLEKQAHYFASAFLMPAQTFADDFNSVISIDSMVPLKSRWRISMGAMLHRASDLNLVGPEKARRMWINMTRRGWRLQEPLDDVLEIDQPRFLRRSFDLLLNNQVVTRQEIEHHTGLKAADIEDVVGLPPGFLGGASQPTLFKLPPSLPKNDWGDNPEGLVFPFNGHNKGA